MKVPDNGPWVWNTNDLKPAKAWIKDPFDDTPALQPPAEFSLYPSGVNPPPPTDDLPMQYVSPQAAIYFARLLGCRLPTPEEWNAANSLNNGGQQIIKLRDQTWVNQFKHFEKMKTLLSKKGLDQIGSALFWLDNDIFTHKHLPVSAAPDARSRNNGTPTPWFVEVDPGPLEAKVPFHHLVGNVSEYVLGNPEDLKGIQDPIGLRSFLKDHLKQLKVVGGSALSPKELNDKELPNGVEPANGVPVEGSVLAPEGYSDVGFRLAFDSPVSTGPDLVLVRKLIQDQPYLPVSMQSPH
jgi:hypothetical protein